MVIRIRDHDNTDELLRILEEMKHRQVQVGLFGSDDSHMVMIGTVHEFGANIKAKGKFLTIPTRAAGGRSARDFGPELFRPKGKNILAVAKSNGELEVMFILKESVTIPERSFLRSAFDEHNREWTRFANEMIPRVLAGALSVDALFDRLGQRMVADVQAKIRSISSPPNAPITRENKGSSNPLIDSGRMRQSITYKVVRI